MERSSPAEGPVERLRVVFSRNDDVKYMSHLDTMRTWERILRRGQVPVAYTQGFNPQPRIALASPLPVGVSSVGEVMDIYLDRRLEAAQFRQLVAPQMPVGFAVERVEEAGLSEPSLQSRLRFADYVVEVESDLSRSEMEERVRGLLEAQELIRERRREKDVRRYDLRPLVEWVGLRSWNGSQSLEMQLRNSSNGAGRPEEVAAALGLGDVVLRIHRLGLVFEGE